MKLFMVDLCLKFTLFVLFHFYLIMSVFFLFYCFIRVAHLFWYLYFGRLSYSAPVVVMISLFSISVKDPQFTVHLDKLILFIFWTPWASKNQKCGQMWRKMINSGIWNIENCKYIFTIYIHKCKWIFMIL